jgi:TRAP transporter TAXI family solute receptor
VREFLRSNWHVVTIAVTAGVIVCVAVFLLSTMPPRSIAMGTGPEGGGYYEIGRQYQELLARAGVKLKVIETAGSLENLELLRDPKSGVDIALVQGGNVGQGYPGELESLGTLFYEPLWIFHRGALDGATLSALRGRKVSIGPVGSGSHALLLRLLKRNEIDQEVGELLALPPEEAADKLLAGEIDAAAMLASWEAPVVQQLIADDRVELLNLARADAYVALYPFLSKATVPRGVGDLAKDLPPDRRNRVRIEGEPRGAQGCPPGDPISSAEHRGADPLRSEHVPSRRTFSCSRRHRAATEQRGCSVLQIRSAVPAAQSSVLDGVAGWTPADLAHPDRRRAVSDVSVSARSVRLVNAPEDRETLWRAKVPRGRDHKRRPDGSHSADGPTRPTRETGEPAQDADCL